MKMIQIRRTYALLSWFHTRMLRSYRIRMYTPGKVFVHLIAVDGVEMCRDLLGSLVCGFFIGCPLTKPHPWSFRYQKGSHVSWGHRTYSFFFQCSLLLDMLVQFLWYPHDAIMTFMTCRIGGLHQHLASFVRLQRQQHRFGNLAMWWTIQSKCLMVQQWIK